MGKFKSRKIARTACAILTAICTAAAPVMWSGASADTTDYDKEIAQLEQKAEQIKKDNEAREQKIDALSGNVDENNAQMGLLQEQIEGINDEITTYGQLITTQQQKIGEKENEIYLIEQEIEKKQGEIEEKQKEIASLEAQNKENLKKFAKLIRALYMNNTADTLPILEGSNDWYNFFTYVDVVQNISEQNLEFMNNLLNDIHHQEELIEGLEKDIAQLNADKADLLDKKAELETELADLENKKTEVQQIANERTNDLYALSSDNQDLQNQISQINSEIDASNEDVEAINQAIKELIRKKQAENSGAPVYSSDGFRWPLDSNLQYITTYFGYDAWRGGNHYGIDVGNAGIGGKNIYAAQSGTVITAYSDGGWHGGFGNYVIIDHGGELSTVYAHCSSVTVSVGQTVNKGDVIGYVGSTGWSTGNHLHFETRVDGTAVDPFSYSYEYV
ncbi:MAG: peptidoglycan DD-metalloendopeptidase family protein [Oscillospiraceae bacterium]|nr:peptidoglycan DD-metalloendopeptidase family protein [Oscillospiraceae bacterium]